MRYWSKPLPGLRETQEAFATALLDDPDTAFSALLADGTHPGARLLQVYRNNVCISLTGALQAVYPVVTQLVGTAFFAYAADSYLRRYPSRSGNLHDFGREFAEFLGAFPAAMATARDGGSTGAGPLEANAAAVSRELAYLPQVARLEWAWHCAFHGADHAPLAPATLSTVPAELYGAIVFLLHPTARLVTSDYPVLRLWQMHQADYTGDQQVDLTVGGDRLLVVRPHTVVQIVPLGRGEYALLQFLMRGASLAEACDAALCQEAEFDLAGMLQKHVRHATLVAFQITDTGHPGTSQQAGR